MFWAFGGGDGGGLVGLRRLLGFAMRMIYSCQAGGVLHGEFVEA